MARSSGGGGGAPTKRGGGGGHKRKRARKSNETHVGDRSLILPILLPHHHFFPPICLVVNFPQISHTQMAGDTFFLSLELFQTYAPQQNSFDKNINVHETFYDHGVNFVS